MNYEESTETIYGTNDQDSRVMSEKVQTLARTIYKELERMIARYDEDVVKTLMPLVVNVLECLDSAQQSNQEQEVELELLREDNEQLVTQYEREKVARKHAEQKLLETEDHFEGERKELAKRLGALENIVRMLELKHKNALDHASRLEERENEVKKEHAKLHERYTLLLKTHMDYMERAKLLVGTSSDAVEVRGRLGLNPMRSSGPISFGFASLESSMHNAEQTESMPGSPSSLSSTPPSPPAVSQLASLVRTVERAHQTDPITQQSQATSPVVQAAPANQGKSQTKSEKRSGNTLYQELSFQDVETNIAEGEDADNITGSWVHPGEYASSVNDNYFGMGKEVENLILENNELLATKNALNVVKDDLIAKVDELMCELEILRERVANLTSDKDKLAARVSELEDEVKRLKELLSVSAGGGENEDEADVPMAQRRRFTRVEMARVLMERNQYKERFMELQDAVRFTEMVRATRVDTTMDKKNKQSIWKFFSNLFSTGERPQRPLSTPHLRAVAAPQPALRHSRTQADFFETQLTDHHPARRHERSEQFRQVRAHVRKEDGRTQAYGWSLPGKTGQGQKGPSSCTSLSSGGVPVPVPVFCRPIAENEPRMTLLCAAAVNLSGGRTPDGGCMVGGSVFYSDTEEKPENPMSLAYEMSKAQLHSPEVEQINQQLQSTQSVVTTEKNLSSLVWVCCSNQNKGVVMIIDANNPAEAIDSFSVTDKHILCVASVPGAFAEDYADFTERVSSDKRHSDSTEVPEETTEANSEKDAIVVGSTRLVKATILTPPSTPVNEPAPEPQPEENAEDDGEKVVEADPVPPDSPPLSSTPTNGGHLSSPEPGVEAFVQQQAKVEESGETAPARCMSTVLATMWLGTKSGNLYVHSAVGNYGKCLARVKLNDAILAIVACASRCMVALADGTVAIFARLADGQWDFSKYWLLTLGDPKCSVRCLSVVGCMVWCGYRNKVHVVEPRSRMLLHTLEAHPRQESQVRQMACDGDGVWVSIKMDSTLRLYHAHTYQHLKDVDIEPYVSKMLGTGKLGFSLVRITALLISSGRLWIGTSNGVVISVPLSEGSSPQPSTSRAIQASYPTGNIPWCSMAHAQLSFHGHRDAVTFFVAVPGAGTSPPRTPESPRRATPSLPPMLVISGGEGYIDFRIEENADDVHDTAAHVIVWQVIRERRT